MWIIYLLNGEELKDEGLSFEYKDFAALGADVKFEKHHKKKVGFLWWKKETDIIESYEKFGVKYMVPFANIKQIVFE